MTIQGNASRKRGAAGDLRHKRYVGHQWEKITCPPLWNGNCQSHTYLFICVYLSLVQPKEEAVVLTEQTARGAINRIKDQLINWKTRTTHREKIGTGDIPFFEIFSITSTSIAPQKISIPDLRKYHN